MSIGILDLTLVILIAAVLALILKIFKQPLIVAYLITGAIVGYFNLVSAPSNEVFKVFSDLGIMFLLFLIGLEINYDSLRMVSRPAVILGIGQIVFTFVFGFLIAKAFNFGALASAYIS
ncbi:MAG: cation:proton antiporter, partial [Minisyncoccia bacterium]